MAPKYKTLLTHTDRFSLFDKVRKGKQNNRKYMLEAVKRMFNSQETQEGLRLGELYGYYGHTRRELAKTPELPETSVIMVEGKPVVIENVPASRTIAISVDDDGVVTHTEEIFDTAPGRIVASMLESRAGGWSWVTTGRDSPAISIPTGYYGMDYVTMPNFISMDHPAAMRESTEDRNAVMTEALIKQNFTEEDADGIIKHYTALNEYEVMFESIQRIEELEVARLAAAGELLDKDRQLEEQSIMLESLRKGEAERAEKTALRTAMFERVLDKLPVFTNQRQRDAIASMQTEEDLAIVDKLFESLASPSIRTLPVEQISTSSQPAKRRHSEPVDKSSIINFESTTRHFG